jgi:hypothetical protein
LRGNCLADLPYRLEKLGAAIADQLRKGVNSAPAEETTAN